MLAMTATVTGCFSTREIQPLELSRLEEPTVCRIVDNDGHVVRGIVHPQLSDNEEIVYYRCVYEPTDWQVFLSGWPAVYTSLRHWRSETYGEQSSMTRGDDA